LLPSVWSSPIHFPVPLRSLSITRLPRYYEHSDSCSHGSSGPWSMNTVSLGLQVSLIHAHRLPDHSVSTHLMLHCHRFHTLPLSSTAFLFRSRLRLRMAGSSKHPAVSSSLSYGLVVHLLLLPTTHCCVAVAFGYRSESVSLERTCTSLTTRAFRRTIRSLRSRYCNGRPLITSHLMARLSGFIPNHKTGKAGPWINDLNSK